MIKALQHTADRCGKLLGLWKATISSLERFWAPVTEEKEPVFDDPPFTDISEEKLQWVLGMTDKNPQAWRRSAEEQGMSTVDAIRDDAKELIEAASDAFQKRKKLIDETFTRDEVSKILGDLCEVTAGELESELINTSHMNLLLFRQLCAQAEKFNINLFINLSELEDRELLDAVQIFEKEHFEKKAAKTATILRHLIALEGTVEERIQRRDSEEKARMVEELSIREMEMAELRRKSEVDRVREQQLMNELETLEHRLLQTKEQLALKESELEKKFANTNAFKTMNHILRQKNSKIKELRDVLKQNDINVTALENESE
uniref:Leucine zipper transcription factor-like protein 1 n=1 Tax=Parascaris univalens TaxID=6257 RepID=A0A915CJ72_PARUN